MGCWRSSNSYFEPGDPNNEQDLNALNGVSQFDPTDIIAELEMLRDVIVALPSDTTFTSGFVNQNIKDAGAVALTDLDAGILLKVASYLNGQGKSRQGAALFARLSYGEDLESARQAARGTLLAAAGEAHAAEKVSNLAQ